MSELSVINGDLFTMLDASHFTDRRVEIMVLCRIVKGAQDGELDITEQVSCYEKAKYELMSAICSLAHPRYRSLDYLDH